MAEEIPTCTQFLFINYCVYFTCKQIPQTLVVACFLMTFKIIEFMGLYREHEV